MRKIKGFLHAEGTRIVDGNQEEIILKGWGLGNWLLQEGYMWQAYDIKEFDRPRRIEKVIRELTGEAYAARFWEIFRRDYIQKEDMVYMAELGYNSVRIPINWRLFMEEEEGIVWKEDGFQLIDQCLEWCEEAGLYAFLDLHGAPGGQTGANIDDSADDIPRLFIDRDKTDKGLALWKKLALRYREREVVGGYDLLNEPVAPGSNEKNFDSLLPEVTKFYKDAITAIRKVDTNHMLSIEGIHWAVDLEIFTERFDDNMVLHFHRYGEKPEKKCLDTFIAKSKELNVPLWMGESGENCNEWYAALYPLAEALGIGYNLWPWKKMECTNSPCSIKAPEDYELILEYAKGGPHPGSRKAEEILDRYLENIRLEKCLLYPEVTNHVMRKIPFSMYAVDFDELPGPGRSFGGAGEENPAVSYRTGCGMRLAEVRPEREPGFPFDSQWDRYALAMGKDEFVCYSFEGCKKLLLTIELEVKEDAQIKIETELSRKILYVYKGDKRCSVRLNTVTDVMSVVKLQVAEGEVYFIKLIFEKAE